MRTKYRVFEYWSRW